MGRKIFGKITDQNGAPAQGLRVQAWDDDWPDTNDLMGESITDGNGDYSVDYDGRYWDPAPAPNQITTWRPDIFIAVQAQNAAGGWAHLAKSSVHSNHKMRDDLRIDLRVTINPIEKKITSFSPALHGFHFDNSFTLQPSIFDLELGSWDMGFCGGMCAAATNRFNIGEPIPNDTAAPIDGSSLFEELLKRQKRTMPIEIIRKVYDWQRRPDEGGWNKPHSLGYLTKQEWSSLKVDLDAGHPTILVLIRVEGYVANVSKNHQVLAIGYEWNPVTKDLAIQVYDPNDHGKINTLSMNLGLPNSKLRASDSTGKRLRGFFINTAGPAAST